MIAYPHTALIAVALLVGVVLGFLCFLLWREFVRKERETRSLQEVVKERTAELAALSSHLQDVSEREKQALARELHDALGGLLVATKMDVAWLRSRLPTEDPDLQLRWKRIQQSLDQGVNLKRRIVEQLRPTLLDNMGLYAALSWQFQETCSRAGMHCIEILPQSEHAFKSEAAIALFRVAQESFTNILKHSGATEVHLGVTVEDDMLVLTIRDNGRGFSQSGISTGTGQGIAGMRHRAAALGGTLETVNRPEGGAEIRFKVPLSAIQRNDIVAS